MTPEGAVVKAVIEYLNYSGYWVWRRNVGSLLKFGPKGERYYMKFGLPGMADIEGIAPGGKHIELEIKAPGKKPTKEQEAWLASARAKGAIALWCDSVDMLIEKLKDADGGQ